MQPGKWKLASSDMIKTSKTDFIIIYKVQELHTEIWARSFTLYHQFMGYVNFVQMNPQDFIQNSVMSWNIKVLPKMSLHLKNILSFEISSHSGNEMIHCIVLHDYKTAY